MVLLSISQRDITYEKYYQKIKSEHDISYYYDKNAKIAEYFINENLLYG
jgi:hypothetical protein